MIGKILNEATGITLEQFAQELKGNCDIEEITKNNVLKNSSIVYSCINLIASTISKMGIDLFEYKGNEINKVHNSLSIIVSNRPYKYYSSSEFIQAMVALMLIEGQAFALIETRKGVPTELIILPQSTRLQKIGNKYVVLTTVDDKPMTLDYNRVLHFRDLNLDGVNGISRIHAIRNKLSSQLQGEKMIRDFYKNGGGIKGFLETPTKLSKEAKLILKENVMSILLNGQSGVGILDNELTYKPVSTQSIADTQFIDNMKLTKEEICSIFGVNPALVGASEQATNSNMQQMNNSFIQSLMPILKKMEQEMNYKLLTSIQRETMYWKFNQASALRADDKARADYYQVMLQNGIMTVNECRALENLNPILGGDVSRVDLNHVNIEKIDEYQLNKSTKGGE